jgi:hypothetical protein
MLVAFDVDSLVLQLEAHVVATFIAWRKGLAINARYFVRRDKPVLFSGR